MLRQVAGKADQLVGEGKHFLQALIGGIKAGTGGVFAGDVA